MKRKRGCIVRFEDVDNKELLQEYRRIILMDRFGKEEIGPLHNEILNRMNPETAERVKIVVSISDSELPAFEHKQQDYIDWMLQWQGIDITKNYTVSEVPGGKEFSQMGIKRARVK